MKFALLGCLVGGLLFAGSQDSDLNVNRRYKAHAGLRITGLP